MQKLLEQISQRFQSFINQRDDLALIVRSMETDSVPLLKILEGLEEASASDLYWIFTDNFLNQESYANDVISSFATKHELIRLSMEKEGMNPWQPIPQQILSEKTPPAQRLRNLAAFSRELLPVPNGGMVIWGFYPLEIADHTAYALLMEEILQHKFPFPWCHHLRFIIRDDSETLSMEKQLSTLPRIQWYKPDLSMDAINRSMEEDIADETLPLDARLNTLMVMAGMDYAYGYFPQALEKYELLLQYYAPMGNLTMAALSLNGMGMVYEKLGELRKANESYEAAIVPASQGDHPPITVLLNIILNLANIRRNEKRWEDAEAYFDMAQQLSTANRDASLKIRSLEDRGICQQKQGKYKEACASWDDGLVMAAQLQDVQLCRDLLGRLKQLYSETGQAAREHEVSEQLTALNA